jgi:hypothetical protein
MIPALLAARSRAGRVTRFGIANDARRKTGARTMRVSRRFVFVSSLKEYAERGVERNFRKTNPVIKRCRGAKHQT